MCTPWDQRKIFLHFVLKILKEKSLQDNTPFSKAQDMSISFTKTDYKKVDVFLDGGIYCRVDVGKSPKTDGSNILSNPLSSTKHIIRYTHQQPKNHIGLK